MHCVCHLTSFVREADAAGMTQSEVDALEDFLARNPTAGDEIVGTGGCRKLRWAGKGKGKSGGFRIITFFSGPTIPIYLLTVFAKNERATLTSAEKKGLKKLTEILVTENKFRVVEMRAGA